MTDYQANRKSMHTLKVIQEVTEQLMKGARSDCNGNEVITINLIIL